MMTLIPWLLVSFFLLAMAAYAWQRRRGRLLEAGTDLNLTLQACQLLVTLIGHLQQHRGMSSAWLAGDAAFKVRMLDKQAQIAALLPALLAAARREGGRHCPCLTGNDLSLFTFRWKSLLDELPRLTPEQNIAQHSQLLNRVLEWLAALGEARLEPLAMDGKAVGAARNFAHRLPLLTECLGQARAIGSSVAARHACAPVARVRLLFLISRAEALLEQAVAAHDGGTVTRQSQLAIEKMASTVRTRMLLSSGVVVSSGDYFALATQAIDRVFEWIAVCGGDVARSGAAVGCAELKVC